MQSIYVIDADGVRVEALLLALQPLQMPLHVFADTQRFFSDADVGGGGCVLLELRRCQDVATALQLISTLVERGGPPTVILSDQILASTAVEAVRRGAIEILDAELAPACLRRSVQEALRIDQARRAERHRRNAMAARVGALSADQREVLVMLLEGHSNKEIAHRLKMGLRTAERHRADALQRLGAGSLVDAALSLAWLAGRTELAIVQATLRSPDRRRAG